MNLNQTVKPLVVDLDGTLIKTDLLYESASNFIGEYPLRFFQMLGWLKKGKSYLKARCVEAGIVDVTLLPYNSNLVSWLHQQKALGRVIVLATASHRILADAVAEHLGFFDEVMATEGEINLKSKTKRDVLVGRFGERGFDYIGNDHADFPVWSSADTSYLVSSSSTFTNKVDSMSNLGEVFPDERPPLMQSLFKALRPHQWIKNLLIVVPLLAAHRLGNLSGDIDTLIAFIVFCLTASSVYVLNDLLDVADDRSHHYKRKRPFAAGHLSLLLGWFFWPSLLIVALFIACLALPGTFIMVLITYFVLTLAYSLWLKQSTILDVLTLACLYTLRLFAGAAAAGVFLSFWLLTFSMFFFLSLAFIKRFSEIQAARQADLDGQIRGRGYVHQDLEVVSSMGIGAGYLSILVLALYIQDFHTAVLYHSPMIIWLACPILLYWISRAWLLAHRGEMHDDPTVFAIKDPTSWVVSACFLSVFLLAKVV